MFVRMETNAPTHDQRCALRDLAQNGWRFYDIEVEDDGTLTVDAVLDTPSRGRSGEFQLIVARNGSINYFPRY